MKNLILFFCLLVFSSAYSQSGPGCSDYIIQSMAKYEEKDHKAALELFKKALKSKCSLTDIDYYNGACIASLLKMEDLAFSYLDKSVDKGFENIDHMEKDTDLDHIRSGSRYPKVIQKIRDKYQEMAQIVKSMTALDLGQAIPYVENGKWGWINRMTHTPYTKAVFDYTDFSTAGGLGFVYKSKRYLLANDLSIKPYPSDADEGTPISLAPHEPDISDAPAEGFRTNGREILTHSKKYKEVSLVKEWDSKERIAIALDQNNLKGVIREDGTTLQPFGFSYSDIDYFLGLMKNTFFLARKSGSNHYLIYDRAGKEVYTNPISRFDKIYNYQRTPLNHHIFVGTYYLNYLIVYDASGKANVLDESSLKTIFKKNYDQVLMLNGPTGDKDRSGGVFSQGIQQPYFLVRQGKKVFYVDENGREYLAK